MLHITPTYALSSEATTLASKCSMHTNMLRWWGGGKQLYFNQLQTYIQPISGTRTSIGRRLFLCLFLFTNNDYLILKTK